MIKRVIFTLLLASLVIANPQISVFTYNILDQELLEKNGEVADYLKWPVRKAKIEETLRKWNPDIFCLQEAKPVDRTPNSGINLVIDTKKYKTFNTQKNDGFTNHGTLFGYNQHIFQKAERQVTDFNDEFNTKTGRYEQVQHNFAYVRLQMIKGGQFLNVIATHLKSKLDCERQRVDAVQKILRFIEDTKGSIAKHKKEASQSEKADEEEGWIVVGDMNSYPQQMSQLILRSEFISAGHHQYGLVGKAEVEKRLAGDYIKEEEGLLGISDNTFPTSIKVQPITKDPKGPSAVIQKTVDYIYFGNQALKFVSVDRDVPDADLIKDGCPNVHCPSDHMPVIAKLEFVQTKALSII